MFCRPGMARGGACRGRLAIRRRDRRPGPVEKRLDHVSNTGAALRHGLALAAGTAGVCSLSAAPCRTARPARRGAAAQAVCPGAPLSPAGIRAGLWFARAWFARAWFAMAGFAGAGFARAVLARSWVIGGGIPRPWSTVIGSPGVPAWHLAQG